MKLMSTRIAIALQIAFSLGACGGGPREPAVSEDKSTMTGTGPSELIGAWQAVEIVVPAPGDVYDGVSVVGPSGPGLRLFTETYYSHFLITNTHPRPALPSSPPTVDDLLAIWGPFGANGGPYEVRADTIVFSPIVAKNPRAMTPGRQTRLRFRISADSLWILGVRDPSVIKYVRVGR